MYAKLYIDTYADKLNCETNLNIIHPFEWYNLERASTETILSYMVKYSHFTAVLLAIYEAYSLSYMSVLLL